LKLIVRKVLVFFFFFFWLPFFNTLFVVITKGPGTSAFIVLFFSLTIVLLGFLVLTSVGESFVIYWPREARMDLVLWASLLGNTSYNPRNALRGVICSFVPICLSGTNLYLLFLGPKICPVQLPNLTILTYQIGANVNFIPLTSAGSPTPESNQMRNFSQAAVPAGITKKDTASKKHSPPDAAGQRHAYYQILKITP
jgi:hypothetical protein